MRSGMDAATGTSTRPASAVERLVRPQRVVGPLKGVEQCCSRLRLAAGGLVARAFSVLWSRSCAPFSCGSPA